jgi:hypothetical protein
MKPLYLFYFENEPERIALDSRQRTARILRSYRNQRNVYTITRAALNSYRVKVSGFASAILIHSQEFTA